MRPLVRTASTRVLQKWYCAPRWFSAPALQEVLRPSSGTRPVDRNSSSSTPLIATGFCREGNSAAAPSLYDVVDRKRLEKLIQEALDSRPLPPPPTASQERLTKARERFYHTKARRRKSTVLSSINYFPPEEVTTDYSNHLVRELTRLRRKTVEELLQEKIVTKEKIDRYVQNFLYPALKYTCFALMVAQFGLYFNWIFFVFDWNLMEPTTYFLAYTGVFTSLVYHYYRCGREEFTFKNLFLYWSQNEKDKLYVKNRIDAVKVEGLQERLKLIDTELDKYRK